MLAGRGLWIKGIPASSGVLSFFLELHFRQEETRLLHSFLPPLDLGRTWSSSNPPPANECPQYKHLYPSRIKMFFLESVCILIGTYLYSSKRITLGMKIPGYISLSVCSTTIALPLVTRVKAFLAHTILVASK